MELQHVERQGGEDLGEQAVRGLVVLRRQHARPVDQVRTRQVAAEHGECRRGIERADRIDHAAERRLRVELEVAAAGLPRRAGHDVRVGQMHEPEGRRRRHGTILRHVAARVADARARRASFGARNPITWYRTPVH